MLYFVTIANCLILSSSTNYTYNIIMATLYSNKTIRFFDCNDAVITVAPLSWTKRSEFVDVYKDLLKLVTEADDKPIGDLFEQDAAIRSLAINCIELCNVPTSNLALEQIVGLLFPLNEEQTEGLLIKQNFPNVEQKTKLLPPSVKKSMEEIYLANVENLWAATEDLKQAIQLAEEIPADLMNGLMELRAERLRSQLPADERGKLEAQEMLKEKKAQQADMKAKLIAKNKASKASKAPKEESK